MIPSISITLSRAALPLTRKTRPAGTPTARATSRTTSAFGPLPFDAGAFGAPGCSGRVSPDAVAFLLGSANALQWSLQIPFDPVFIGQQFFQQALPVDPGLNALGASFSDAAALFVGN